MRFNVFAIAALGSLASAVPTVNSEQNLAVAEHVLSPINATASAAADHGSLEKRISQLKYCNSVQRQELLFAMRMCYDSARRAARVAVTDPAKVYEYFRSGDYRTAAEVAGVFERVARHCDVSADAPVRCAIGLDIEAYCKPGLLIIKDPILAAVPSMFNGIVFCPLYFHSIVYQVSQTCHYIEDRVSVLIHEITHLPIVQDTEDYAYNYYESVRLPRNMALKNADNYALFANAVSFNAMGIPC